MTHPAQRLVLAMLVALTLLPTSAGLVSAIISGLDAGALARVWAAPGVPRAMAMSVFTGVVSTLIALALAHALVALAVSGRWRSRLTRLSLPILAMPHLALGIGLVIVLAPSGLLLRLVSPWATGLDVPPDWHTVRDPYGLGLILGLVIKETCFLIMALTAALSQVPAQKLQQQAITLGYGVLKGWFVAVAPQLQRQLALPTAAVLVYGLGNVDLALTLGPDLPPTFAVVLWRWLLDATPAIQAMAHAGTLVLLLITVATLGVMAIANRLVGAVFQASAVNGQRRRAERPLALGVVFAAAGGLVLGLAAVLAIVLRSAAGAWRFPAVLPDAISWTSWIDAWPAAGATLGTTAGLAFFTALGSVLLVLPAAEATRDREALRTRLGQWLFVPLLLPQMTFLFGIQVILVRMHADGTWLAVAWMHLIFALPYVWGVLAPARAALDPRFTQVAATLGASPARAWRRVTLPLLTRAALLAAALGASVSLSLYLPTLFAGAGRISTAATEAAAAAGAGSLRQAAVHAILLTVGPLLAFGFAYALGAAAFRHRRDVP